MSKSTPEQLRFPPIDGLSVRGDFDGGALSSDFGPMILRGVDRHIGLTERLAAAFDDKRHPSYITHGMRGLLAQRIYQIACAYEDGNDANALRSDPVFKMGLEQRPLDADADLASAPTFSRLENNALARQLGGGEVASADGMRFVVPVNTLHAGPNRKYFGAERGVTYYNYSTDQHTGFHNIVVPGTMRDSVYILAGLLEQQTSLEPKEIMTDTAGASDVIFGLFWLLGYQFSPRLADVGGARFWRLDPKADYGALNAISRHHISAERIARHWEDMLHVAGSLKLSTITAPELVRSLLKSDRPSGLTKAIADLGRIPKTIHLLRYLDDESYRRRILVQLNRGESRHAVARRICHGQRGEIRKRYRDGQEEQLTALGLVTNAVVLWNTIYMEAALEQLRAEGFEVRPEDVARLSPLQTHHINMLGRYAFLLAEAVANGGMRPLRNPDEDDIWA